MAEAGFRVTGRVQGVGFRWWTRAQATRLGVEGTVRNAADGSLSVRPAGTLAHLIRLRARHGIRGLAAATVIALLLTLAGCGIARSRPDVAPASGTRTVLLLGDELLAQTAPTLAGSLAFFGLAASVVDGTTPGAGLLDWRGFPMECVSAAAGEYQAAAATFGSTRGILNTS